MQEAPARHGFRPAVMKADAVAPDKREAWVTKQVAQGVDVLICHPRLVHIGPVKVVLMAYRKTLQDAALKLVAQKRQPASQPWALPAPGPSRATSSVRPTRLPKAER